jgi:hypothetical protein
VRLTFNIYSCRRLQPLRYNATTSTSCSLASRLLVRCHVSVAFDIMHPPYIPKYVKSRTLQKQWYAPYAIRFRTRSQRQEILWKWIAMESTSSTWIVSNSRSGHSDTTMPINLQHTDSSDLEGWQNYRCPTCRASVGISYSSSQDTIDFPRRVPQYTSASREHISPPTTYTYYPSTTRRSNDHSSPSTEQPDLLSVEQKKPTSRRTCEVMQEPTSAQSDIHVYAAHERAHRIRARYNSLGESHTALKNSLNRAASTGWADPTSTIFTEKALAQPEHEGMHFFKLKSNAPSSTSTR